jgi:hypothetical protein
MIICFDGNDQFTIHKRTFEMSGQQNHLPTVLPLLPVFDTTEVFDKKEIVISNMKVCDSS